MKHIPLLFAVLPLLGACKNERPVLPPLTGIALEEGDLVFRKGMGLKTQMVMQADGKGIYSHAGIVVKPAQTFLVVHVTPDERAAGDTVDRIKMEAPAVFFRADRAEHGAVYRTVDRAKSRLAAAEAIRLWRKGILFDSGYDLADTARMYCTELVWQAYQKADLDITNGQRTQLHNLPVYAGTYILPSDIYLNRELKRIYAY